MDLLGAALSGAATALGATAATVLLLTPGYVFTRSLARGVRGPDQSERTVIAITGAVGVFTHLLFMPVTLSLLAEFTADPSARGLGSHYVALVLWAAAVLLVAPALAAAAVVALRDWNAPGVEWITRHLGLLDDKGEPLPPEQVKAGPGLWISGENILTVEFVRPGESHEPGSKQTAN